MHIAALATSHNRCAVTCRAIGDLYNQILPAGISLTITLVDDGSSDGTPAAVRAAFPHVHIVPGDGKLYWAGGMRHGWTQHLRLQPFDRLLVFNDDIQLHPGALGRLLEADAHARSVAGPLTAISGAFTDETGARITYGGYRRRAGWHRMRFDMVNPSGVPQRIDTLNMNCALISRECTKAIGFLADYFRHCGADIDYGLRLEKAGGSVWLTAVPIGTCQDHGNPSDPAGGQSGFRRQIQRMTGRKGLSVYERLRYCRDHGGVLWPMLVAGPFLKVAMAILLNKTIASCEAEPERASP